MNKSIKSNTIKIKEKTALLDAIEITNIKILHINNFDILINQQLLEVSNGSAKYCTPSGENFTRLCIKNDGLIDKLISGSKIISNKKIDYCILQITIKNSEIGNLKCLSVKQYLNYLEIIQKHLENKYGIITDFSNVSLKKIEINRTCVLDDDFKNYHRVFSLIMANLPHYMKNQTEFKTNTKDNIEYETYYATSAKNSNSERCLMFKIYDKSKQMENRIVIKNNHMRLEITLLGTERIKKSLGTNCFRELTDITINNFFNNQIQKMIVQPFQKWQDARDKYLLELMKKERKRDIKHWQTNVLRILANEEIQQRKPILLDVTELMPLIDYLDVIPRRKYDIRVNFRKQSQKYESVFCNNDNSRMNEVLTKLTAQEDIARDNENNTVKIPHIDGIPETV